MKLKLALILSLLFSCSSNDGVKSEDIEYDIMVQRATQVAIWSMPAVGMIDFVKASRKTFGAKENDLIYLSKPFNSRHGFLTANDVTNYNWGVLSTKKGPVVLELPAANNKVGFFGTVTNIWDQPIVDVGPTGMDKGRGGKYLFLPPNYKGKIPKGYLVLRTDSTQLPFSFRPVLKKSGNFGDAVKLSKKIKIYNLGDRSRGKSMKYFDAYNTDYDSLPYYDYTFFEDINEVVQSNPIREKDKVMFSLAKSIGIEKGKELNPTKKQKKAMLEGLALAYQSMQKFFVTEGQSMVPLWKGKNNWQVWNFAKGQPQAGFPYETEDSVLVDERAGGSYFWITFLPKSLGGGTFYLTGIKDKDGVLLNGSDTYKLNVPKNVPAKDFWSVIAYSMKTKGFIRDAKRVGISSREKESLQVNADGTYDIYFSPKAPEGKESNWIPTGEDFFLLFRLYGPESKDFFKRWSINDIEKL